ncbi:MAG TPA: tungsten formylmethanofuran dehydrogenase, partial [Bacteroidia bacterium]|nr:tungsten formylmethanofuran dehydrogenase [Bacteroidia bacterium]
CLIVTEEPVHNTFAQALAGLVSKKCFESLDAAVEVVGSQDMPAIPLNSILEFEMIPNADKVSKAMEMMLGY